MRLFSQIILILYLPLICFAEENGSDREFIYFPKELSSMDFNYSLGISLTILPRAVVEDEIRQVPLLDFHARLGLPYNFSINGRINSVYIANQISIGLQYSYSIDFLSMGIGNNIAFWYGFAEMEGFDVEATGWINYPFLSVGVDLNEIYISIKTEALIVTNQETLIGETVIKKQKNAIVGYALTLALEQPFWKDNDFLIAVKLNYASSIYQSWLAFSSFDNYMLHPEFIIGFIL